MAKMSEPEIRRVNLTTVVLQLLSMNISKVTEFDFMDPPMDHVSLPCISK
jgi:HrpA-like RNA helicase